MWLIWIAFIVGSFLLGSVPSAYVVVKWRTGQDILQDSRRDGTQGIIGSRNEVQDHILPVGDGSIYFICIQDRHSNHSFMVLI